MDFYSAFMLQLLESQYRYINCKTVFCQRGYGKTYALKTLLKECYTLYHNEQSKRISVKWVNTNLKGVL